LTTIRKSLAQELVRETLSAHARRILKVAKKRPWSVFELADALECSPRAVRAALDELTKAGTHVQLSPDMVLGEVAPRANPEVARIPWSGKRLEFGVVSDTHLGSKCEQVEHLRAFYRECEARQIDMVFHSGDMTDGENMWRGHAYEIHTHGADAQAEYAASAYPKVNGIRTKFINGNHDHSFMRSAGVDVCQLVATHRKDMEYLGPIGRYVELEYTARTRKVFRVHLMHPRGSAPYARSYRTQKIVEGYSGGSKPDMLLAGHLHYQNHLFTRNVHAYQLPCFQKQTSLLKELGLEPVVGGYIFGVEFSKDGSIGRLEQELITYYVPTDTAAVA